MSLTSAYMAGRILFIFGIQLFIHLMLVPGEYEHSTSKIEALQISFKTRNGDFPENSLNDFIYISVFYLEPG
jgi:hypothetical protein